MGNGVTDELERRRRLRARGWREIVAGLVLIGFGAAFASVIPHWLGEHWLAHAELSLTFGVLGFGAIFLGLAHVVRNTGRAKSTARIDLRGYGFRSFVAWRYLMAREHKASIPAAFTALAMLFIATISTYLLKSQVMGHAAKWSHDTQINVGTALLITSAVAGTLAFFALVIGCLRYVFSFFTTVPLVGVWIGTMALVCVLSVMSGFETDLRQKILGSNAHLQITREEGDFTNWREIKERIDKEPGVVASTPYAKTEVVVAAGNTGMNVIIKGIDPATVSKVTDIAADVEGNAEDKAEAMKRLLPITEDATDHAVPQEPSKPGAVDPAPGDMPSDPEPVDYSKPQANDGSAGSGGSPTDAEYLVDKEPVMDPAPPDLVTTDEPPVDYSGSAAAPGAPEIHTVEAPIDTPSFSRRIESLPGILVGRELVKQTHVFVGQEVHVVSPLSDPANPDATGTPIPFNRDYRIAGVFFTGMYEYDLKYVYVTLDSLQRFLDRGDSVDGIEVRLESPDNSDAYVKRLSAELGPLYRVQDWKDINRSLFSALKLEKIAMFIVLGIVILVASFSIIGNLIMVVVEKQREIALLKTIGASDNVVMQVFAIQGLIIGTIGTLIGVSIGLVVCWAGKRFGIPLDPNVYYIDRMPIHVDAPSVAMTAAAGILISMAATFYPALLAARVRPAAGMRH